MTPVEAAARDQRAAASLLDLARAGQRVLHLSPSHRALRAAFDAVSQVVNDGPRDGERLIRANGREACRHPTGGCIHFAALSSAGHRGLSADLVAIGPGVDLTATTLAELAAATNPAGRLRVVGDL